jgi:alpha-tubulin suppressor-like RCC1 family protein
VEFFSEKELKVTDAVIGEHHTIVVTEDGDIWSWGFGGSYDFSPLDWINPRVGALGSG